MLLGSNSNILCFHPYHGQQDLKINSCGMSHLQCRKLSSHTISSWPLQVRLLSLPDTKYITLLLVWPVTSITIRMRHFAHGGKGENQAPALPNGPELYYRRFTCTVTLDDSWRRAKYFLSWKMRYQSPAERRGKSCDSVPKLKNRWPVFFENNETTLLFRNPYYGPKTDSFWFLTRFE